ncbi:TPA: hypothetical protein H1940_004735 [Salmonella enterica]|nr:hypothetical protein [Salmonella enterica]
MAVYTGKMFESENPVYGGTYELIIDEDRVILADDYSQEYYEVEADGWDDDVVFLVNDSRIKFYAVEEEE